MVDILDMPELSTEKLDDYTYTGLKLLLVGLVGSLVSLPLDIAILVIQRQVMSYTNGVIGLMLTGGLAILSLIIRLAGAGYAAKWLYNWDR